MKKREQRVGNVINFADFKARIGDEDSEVDAQRLFLDGDEDDSPRELPDLQTITFAGEPAIVVDTAAKWLLEDAEGEIQVASGDAECVLIIDKGTLTFADFDPEDEEQEWWQPHFRAEWAERPDMDGGITSRGELAGIMQKNRVSLMKLLREGVAKNREGNRFLVAFFRNQIAEREGW